jgi:2-dehydropantoate 2-reductase
LVYISSFIEKPGVVRQVEGSCKLTFGTDDETAKRYKYILDILLKAKIAAALTDKISQAQWTKYLLICPLGSLTTITGKTFGGIIEDLNLKNNLRAMIEEVRAIVKARGVNLPADVVDRTLEVVSRFAYNTKTSMQVDRELGKETEIDIFTAYIAQAGKELGIPTPLHNKYYQNLK